MKKAKLSAANQKLYAEDKDHNFRIIARLFGTRSSYTLTDSDLVSHSDNSETISDDHPSPSSSSTAQITTKLSAWGEFAEIAFGSIDPAFVLREIHDLVGEGFPYEGYTALAETGVKMVGVFKGPGKKGVQGYIAIRPANRASGDEVYAPGKEEQQGANEEIVIAFSGTCTIEQGIQDLDFRRAKYPLPTSQRPPQRKKLLKKRPLEETKDAKQDTAKTKKNKRKQKALVHKGFWRLYSELRPSMNEVLSSALDQHPSADLVITGHSLGGAMAYLLALDILLGSAELAGSKVHGRTISLAAFGCPRIGNSALVSIFNEAANSYRARNGTDEFEEYSVRAYDDGAACLPPQSLGYRHMCQTPFYLYQGRLYRIPKGEAEHLHFNINVVEHLTDIDPDKKEIIYPLGGHNYYNNRSMRRAVRRYVGGLKLKKLGEEGWKDRYLKTLKKGE